MRCTHRMFRALSVLLREMKFFFHSPVYSCSNLNGFTWCSTTSGDDREPRRCKQPEIALCCQGKWVWIQHITRFQPHLLLPTHPTLRQTHHAPPSKTPPPNLAKLCQFILPLSLFLNWCKKDGAPLCTSVMPPKVARECFTALSQHAQIKTALWI